MVDRQNTRMAGPAAVMLFREAIAASTGLDIEDPHVISLAVGYDNAAGEMIEALRGNYGNVAWRIEKGRVKELAPAKSIRFSDR